MRRAEAAGYAAIVLTIDTPILGSQQQSQYCCDAWLPLTAHPSFPTLTGRREADVRNTFQLPPHLQLGILKDAGSQHAEGVGAVCACFCCLQAQGGDTVAHTPTGVKASQGESGLAEFVRQNIDASLQWSDVQWLRKLTKLPVLLKGVMTKEDAVLAVKHGYTHLGTPVHLATQLAAH